MHFFNGDFRHSAELEQFFNYQRAADDLYSATIPNAGFRYGLTAGLVPPPEVYHADRIGDHPHNVFSPEAVAAWGDMNTLLQFYAAQVLPANDPRYKYGMVRVSAEQPSWIPPDAGLVDHLFLLFGLVESLDADFFADRVFPGLAPGDYNADGSVDADDYAEWRKTFGSQSQLWADGNGNGRVDAADYVVWRNGATSAGRGVAAAVPESNSVILMLLISSTNVALARRWRGNRGAQIRD
jgi:hypothetical protein